jgi:hypothetical protein
MPRTAKRISDDVLLEAAITGLEVQQQRIEEQLQQVRLLLNKVAARRGRPPISAPSLDNNGPRRMSLAARKRIATAQKRRWAEYRKSAGKSA